MTETRRWLEVYRFRLARVDVASAVLLTAGVVLGALALGQLLGNAGLYVRVPLAVWLCWLSAGAALFWGAARLVQRLRAMRVERLADVVEIGGGRRRGSVRGPAAGSFASGSAALTDLADRRARAWLEAEGTRALTPLTRMSRRSLTGGSSAFAGGAVLFIGAVLAGSDGGFWTPVAMTLRGTGPLSLVVDRTEVQRGDSVIVSVHARGRRSVELHVRAPGESWKAQELRLDSSGVAHTVIGPLESDRFLRAVAGDRSSDVVRIVVALPALLTDLELLARFPEYLHLSDIPLIAGSTPVPLPVGTRVFARGRVTVPLARAQWVRDTVGIDGEIDGDRFSAAFDVRTSGTWTLSLETVSRAVVEGAQPSVAVIAVPDSAPLVQVPVPGADTVAPLSLRQRLLIDARDDHGIADLSVVSWRVSRLGFAEPPDTSAVPLPSEGVARAVVSWVLDLNERGLVPGDTAYFQVRAVDNAPRPHTGMSRMYRLRLPSISEVRESTRRQSQEARAAADSLVRAQEELAQRVEELSAEQERRGRPAIGSDPEEREQLSYSAVQRAQDLVNQERAVAERMDSLRAELAELANAAQDAGITDPDLQQALRDVRELLERALDRDMLDRIAALQEALDRLDAAGTRAGLEELARAANELRDELRRGRELLERAAIEGDLASLSADADELAADQRAWNETPLQESDSALATREADLAERAERLDENLEQLGAQMDSLSGTHGELQREQQAAELATSMMTQAEQLASQGRRSPARDAGQRASEALDPVGQQLRQRREALARSWRQEVVEQMDRALVETGEMTKRQQEVAGRLGRGESGSDVRSEQAAVREGVDRVLQRLNQAAGKNALVSPQLGTALGFARRRMDDALDALQQPSPDTRQAGALAGQAVEQLNAVIHALLQARGDVQGAASGTGFNEAVERMAQLAEQQGALNGQAGGLVPMMAAGGAEVLQRLRELAAQQRGLAQALERMQAGGGSSAAAPLAEEARQIARRLEQGELTQDVVQRQERLYRRLLDAGRSLESDQEDPRLERQSKSADPSIVAPPTTTQPSETAPRYRFPTWEELRTLAPEERLLILDYFRRLNDVRRP